MSCLCDIRLCVPFSCHHHGKSLAYTTVLWSPYSIICSSSSSSSHRRRSSAYSTFVSFVVTCVPYNSWSLYFIQFIFNHLLTLINSSTHHVCIVFVNKARLHLKSTQTPVVAFCCLHVIWICPRDVDLSSSHGTVLVMWICSCHLELSLSCGSIRVMWICPCHVDLPA